VPRNKTAIRRIATIQHASASDSLNRSLDHPRDNSGTEPAAARRNRDVQARNRLAEAARKRGRNDPCEAFDELPRQLNAQAGGATTAEKLRGTKVCVPTPGRLLGAGGGRPLQL